MRAALSNRLRLGLKAWVHGSPFAQWSYSHYLSVRAARSRKAGRFYEALRDLCTAHSRLYGAGLEQKHLQQIVRLFREACYNNGSLGTHANNRFYREFCESDEAQAIRKEFGKEPVEDHVRLRRHREDGDPARQGHLMVLKAPDEGSGEKGVIMITYNAVLAQLAAVFRLPEILRRYRIVFEPSYSRNFEAALFLYCGRDASLVLASRCEADHEFIHRAELGFESVRLGASDWVDPDLFVPKKETDRTYDIVMVASWMRLKRHSLLFRSLAALHPRRLRVALIGYPWDLAKSDLQREMNQYGVADQCELFESLPADEVAKIVADSKVAIHLSKQEGTNKATLEALCCDTPLIVWRHNLGFPMEFVNPHTGILTDDDQLPEALAWMVDNYRGFRPRQWVLANTGYANVTRILNDALRRIAGQNGEPWSRDIVERVNYINPRYKRDEDRLALESAYAGFVQYLHPTLGVG